MNQHALDAIRYACEDIIAVLDSLEASPEERAEALRVEEEERIAIEQAVAKRPVVQVRDGVRASGELNATVPDVRP